MNFIQQLFTVRRQQTKPVSRFPILAQLQKGRDGFRFAPGTLSVIHKAFALRLIDLQFLTLFYVQGAKDCVELLKKLGAL